MKLINSIALSLGAASVLFFAGCSETASKAQEVTPKKEVVKPTISEEQLGYRNVSLNDEKDVVTPKVKYSDKYAGSGFKFKRAFQDAPPMIPHDTTGMLPITKANNACLGCHMPEVAKTMGATPIPVSHFTNFRPTHSIALEKRNTSSEKLANVSIKKINHLYQGRYNCSQCHAPQAMNVKLITENTFQPEYTSKDGEFKSSWDDTKFMEDIDTTK